MRIPDAYQSDLPPVSNVTLDMKVYEIVEISETSNTITLRFRLQLNWKDSRLTFVNLRNDKSINVIPRDERNQIWRPDLIYTNSISTMNADQDGIIIIEKESDAFLEVVDGIYTNKLYRGDGHSLRYEKKLTMKFSCFYKLYYYPFDTQTCTIGIMLEGIGFLSMR